MSKAVKLIEAAEKYERGRANGSTQYMKNPFRKPWGLQTDGDLWEQAWLAVLKRGPGNQKVRKVKGHATAEDVEKGIATQEERVDNDKSDTNADKGVE